MGSDDDKGQSITLQTDGKILVAGYSLNRGVYDFALARYLPDGNLDTSFDGDGRVTTSLYTVFNDESYSVALQPDGKILLAGRTSTGGQLDFALVRYLPNGTLDTSFDGDGKLTTALGSHDDFGESVILQADGKILLAGYSWNGSNYDFALTRYLPDGRLDTSFDGDGKLATVLGSGDDYGQSVTLQADGKILLAGYSWNGSNHDFALARYLPDGRLDTSFSADGKLTTALGSGDDYCQSVTLQADGKILLAGYSFNGSNNDFALVRYNLDGSLDTSFSGDGKLTTALSSFDDEGYSITLQADGKILVAGTSRNGSNNDFALVRYNPDGSLDASFGAQYSKGGAPVVIDSTVRVSDAELDARGHYQGASITLQRHGSSNPEDVFAGSNNLSLSGAYAVLHGVTIGRVVTSSGTLTLKFNTNATPDLVNEALASLAYSNTAENPPETVLIDWLFSDSNTDGKQGTGGVLSVLGSTVVVITQGNEEAPFLTLPTPIDYTDTAFDDSFAVAVGNLVASDLDSSFLSYGLDGGKTAGSLVSKTDKFGTLSLNPSTGDYSFNPKDIAIEQLKASEFVEFTVTVSDGELTDSQVLRISLNQNGITESNGNDRLTGTANNDTFNALSGNDSVSGGTGDDVLTRSTGNDTLLGGDGNDSLVGGSGNDLFANNPSGNDTVVGGTDTLSYAVSTDAVTVNLALTTAQVVSTASGSDTISGIENLIGSGFSDSLTGNAVANVLTGRAGADRFVFASPLSGLKIDTISDFVSGQDVIALSATVFTAFAAQVGNTIGLSSILNYNAATGILTYDADAIGEGAAVSILLLGTSSHPATLGSDFLIIA
jgi:uncharacterized delta-60 repeat protein